MKVCNIQWDTAGEDTDSPELPADVIIPNHIAEARNVETISDWLSDEYGFCHSGFTLDDGMNSHEI